MYRLCRVILILGVFASYWAVLAFILRLGGLFWIIIAFAVAAAAKRRRYEELTAFGTARWANANDLRRAGMLGAKTGLIIGRVVDEGKPSLKNAQRDLFDVNVPAKEACEQFVASLRFGEKPKLNPAPVRLPNAVHTAVFAPTGVGKGVSCVIPFLLASDESAVVVDFKGENYQLTAEYRRNAFGHRIVAIDPFRAITQTPDTFNPLEFIDRNSPTAIDDCRDLAEALVIRTGQEREPHWNAAAELFIGGLCSLVAYYGEPEDRSLQTVRTLLTNPVKLDMAMKLLCASDACGGMLSRFGGQLMQFKDKELGSTLTTTNRFLRFLDTLAISESTETSSFNPADLLSGKMTVYLILPPEHMRAQSPLLRMWIGSLLRAVVRGGLQERNKVRFVLDEAASLGHMESLDDAVDKYRSYSVRLHFFFQSLGQLKKSFPDGGDMTFLSNVSQTFFGVNDLQTAEYVSNRLGENTIVLRSGGTGTGTSRQYSSKGETSTSYSTNESSNWSQLGRRLFKPEEVLALSQRTAITFTPKVPPVVTTLVRYYEESLVFHEPGESEQFKLKMHVILTSVSVLLLAVGLAVFFSRENPDRFPAEELPSRYRQRIHHSRKAVESWQDATSSKS